MMTAPYYTGDNVPLRFSVSDDNGAVNPTAATVIVRKPTRELTTEADANITGNIVSYTVPVAVTNEVGTYAAFFELTLPDGLTRTHRVEFAVVANPG